MALVLFFDGECGFCTRSVRWVYRLDRKGAVEFAPLQGELSKRLGLEKFADEEGGTMVVIREGSGERFFKSDAWIALARGLGGGWKLVAAAIAMFPKSWRDAAYDLFARNRYRVAGKGSACSIPDEGLRKRMRE